MKNSNYWQDRFKQLEEAQHEWGAKAFGEIEKQYREAQKELEAAIDKWYRRFAENNNISMAEARKWLTRKDLKEFKWSVEEYIAYGEEHAISGRWAKELENASAKYHISRLEALKIQTQQALERLFTSQNKTITDTLSDVFRTGYYRTTFELQKGFEIGFDVGQIDNDYLAKVLAKPWAVDGKNFSERIWDNKEKLINELHTELSRNIITGADPQKAIDAISHKLDVSKTNAGRLVMTEEAYFSSLAQKECFEDLDVEEYEIVATLDNKTSEICQEMDGQHFPMKDFEAGVTAPPFHVNCRSTTCPYFNDEFSLGERAARDENGEVYYVPSDMTYPEWKKAFVDGGSKEELKSLKQKFKDIKADIGSEEKKAVRQIEKDLAKISDIPIGKIEMTGLPYKSAKSIYDSYDKVLTQYPELKGYLSSFKYEKKVASGYASCKPLKGEIFAHSVFSNYEQLESEFSRDVALGFHPEGTDCDSIIVHELGHCLDGYLTKKQLCGGVYTDVTIVRSSVYLQEKVFSEMGYIPLVKDVLLKQGFTSDKADDIINKNKNSFIEKHVGIYAARDEKEFFSECFAEYITSDNPREAAQILGRLVNEALGR